MNQALRDSIEVIKIRKDFVQKENADAVMKDLFISHIELNCKEDNKFKPDSKAQNDTEVFRLSFP